MRGGFEGVVGPPSAPPPRAVLTRRACLSLAAGTGALAAVAGLAGCGLPPTGDPGSPRPLPAERAVFGVSGGGSGFSPAIFSALQAPSLLVYGSGLVLRADADGGGPLRAVPSRYVQAQVDPQRVARFVADVERRQVLQADLGSPQVTDLGSTTVWVHGTGERRQVSAYAFAEQFDRYLPWAARRHRRRLRAIIAEAAALIADAGRPYVPPRVVVLEQRSDDRSPAPRWPGPAPTAFLHPVDGYTRGALACGELTGDAAARVYAAALGNPEQRWWVDGRTRVLAVNPLPIEIDC